MLNLLTVCLAGLLAAPVGEAGAVRIGLFGLFKPQSLEARVLAVAGATLAAGSQSDARLGKDEMVRVRRAGARLSVSIVDAFGRTRQTFDASAVTLTPMEATPFELRVPSKITRRVRGRLTVAAAAGELRIALGVEREAAVAAVVAAELGSGRAGEAYKALAVVVRTFMTAHLGRHRDEGFDLCDTTHCQVYRGEDDLLAQASGSARSLRTGASAIEQAVTETAGEVLRFEHQLIEGHYTAACGGTSATPTMVWGGATKSSYPYRARRCQWCAASPYREWQRQASAAAVLAALGEASGARLSPAAQLRAATYPASEVVQSVTITDRGRQYILGGDAFRRAIGRRIGWNRVLSPSFRLARRGDHFIFRGRGFGSQVGLCVAGASQQALGGHTYREILDNYFPEAVGSRE